jgi:hypothetical protein
LMSDHVHSSYSDFDTAQMRGIAAGWAERSLILSPVLVGTAGQTLDDPRVAVSGIAIVLDFHRLVGNI